MVDVEGVVLLVWVKMDASCLKVLRIYPDYIRAVKKDEVFEFR